VKLLSSPTGVSIVLYRTTSQDYFDKAPVSPDGTPVIGIPMTATRCGADRFLFPILLPDVGTQPLLYILVGSSLLGAAVNWLFRIKTTGVNLGRLDDPNGIVSDPRWAGSRPPGIVDDAAWSRHFSGRLADRCGKGTLGQRL
jgi:hypothetical protein